MITEKKIDQILRKIQMGAKGVLNAHSVCFENMAPGEEPDEIWRDISEDEEPELTAAIKMGLVSRNYREFQPEYEGQQIPSGGDYFVSLTGLGTKRLILNNISPLCRAGRQVVNNLPTIFAAVAISLLGAWALHFFGPNQNSETTETPLSGAIK